MVGKGRRKEMLGDFSKNDDANMLVCWDKTSTYCEDKTGGVGTGRKRDTTLKLSNRQQLFG